MIRWEITPDNTTLLTEIKEFEGTKEYQAAWKEKSFRNGRFWVYKDHLGYDTIGYGHLVKKGEDFSKGLTEAEAERLLAADLKTSVEAAFEIATKKNISDQFIIQLTLVEMVFQLGKEGVLGFSNTLSKMSNKDYRGAADGMLNSKWARQTPERVSKMAERVRALA